VHSMPFPTFVQSSKGNFYKSEEFTTTFGRFYLCHRLELPEGEKAEKNRKVGVWMHVINENSDSLFKKNISFSFEVYSGGRLTDSEDNYAIFYQDPEAWGEQGWIKPDRIRQERLVVKVCGVSLITKVKIWVEFDDFALLNYVQDQGWKHYEALLFDEQTCKLSFKVDSGELIPVHRGFFLKRVELLRPRGNETEIVVPGVSAEVFRYVIKWVYTEKFDLGEFADPTVRPDDSKAFVEEIFTVARRFGLNRLTGIIVEYWLYILSIHNFGEMYQLATRLDLDDDLEGIKVGALRMWTRNLEVFNENTEQVDIVFPEGLDHDAARVIYGLIDDEDDSLDLLNFLYARAPEKPRKGKGKFRK
jgi:hypothetical protein